MKHKIHFIRNTSFEHYTTTCFCKHGDRHQNNNFGIFCSLLSYFFLEPHRVAQTKTKVMPGGWFPLSLV